MSETLHDPCTVQTGKEAADPRISRFSFGPSATLKISPVRDLPRLVKALASFGAIEEVNTVHMDKGYPSLIEV